ncbi:LptE family protein [bacterium]|nr:LptE family protein [bacterium]
MALVIFMTIFYMISGCWYYSFTDKAYSHLKTTYVAPFENETSEYGIEITLNEKVINALVGGHQFSIESDELADSRFEGKILDVIREAYSYNQEEQVELYRVKIIAQITFYDKINNQQLWQKRLDGWGTYSPEASDDVAREDALEMIADKIIEQLQS